MLIKGLEGATAREIKELEAELKRLGLAIQVQRRKVKLSQEALAEVLDVSVNTIKYVEQGRRVPSLPMLLRICWKIELEYKIGKKN